MVALPAKQRKWFVAAHAVTALANLQKDEDINVKMAKKFMDSTVGTKSKTDTPEYMQARCR